MIPFNNPLITGSEQQYINEAIQNGKFCGDGEFIRRCNSWLEENTATSKALLTTSCTHALELAALLIDVQPGDEIIMPSFTFVSTANPFVLRGAKVIFVDIRPDTMNLDEQLIEDAVTEKTKAIVPVHYAGVGCDMNKIMTIAEKHNLYVIEDAAQGIMASYKNQPLGSIGHIGALSFHETKNIHCGEGGAILINDERFIERAEIVREKGTNRKQFLRGEVDKYTWVDIGSSYLPSEVSAAFLYAQMGKVAEVTQKRLHVWNIYYEKLKPLEEKGLIKIPFVPEQARHNGHLFYIKLKDIGERQEMIDHLKGKNIQAVFHYIPLHSSKAGKRYGTMKEDEYTTVESERLLRLPLFFSLGEAEQLRICETIVEFVEQIAYED